MILAETRVDFLNILPKNGIIVEIGVDFGGNAENIYKLCKPAHLYLVDKWPISSAYQKVINWSKQYDNITLLKQDSKIASQQFKNNFFDVVYIDADHSYEAVTKDIISWFPKVKKGGILGGHDYTDNAATRAGNYGVVQAVDDFMRDHNLEFYMLSNVMSGRDWAIKI